MDRTLADLSPNESSRIREVVGRDGLSHRLCELGFTPGEWVGVVRSAPLGDPLQVRIRGFDVALRRSEARCVLVESA